MPLKETGGKCLFLECRLSPGPALPVAYLCVTQIQLPLSQINSALRTSFFYGRWRRLGGLALSLSTGDVLVLLPLTPQQSLESIMYLPLEGGLGLPFPALKAVSPTQGTSRDSQEQARLSL